VHGIGDVDAEEMRRKQREWDARQPVQRCGVDGCEFQTKHKRDLNRHQARVHGIGDVDAEELRRKDKESRARQPAQRCGVDGCEFQTKYRSDLERHRARVHEIGAVEKATDFATGSEASVAAFSPRSRRARPAVDYAALAGAKDSGGSDAEGDFE
jgi:hypothetical protein